LRSLDQPHRAIHIHAADGDDPLRDAAKSPGQFHCLAPRTQNEVNHHIKAAALKFCSIVDELVAVTDDLAGPLRRRSFPAMKDGHLVPALLKVKSRGRAHEAGSADKKNLHTYMLRPTFSVEVL